MVDPGIDYPRPVVVEVLVAVFAKLVVKRIALRWYRRLGPMRSTCTIYVEVCMAWIRIWYSAESRTKSSVEVTVLRSRTLHWVRSLPLQSFVCICFVEWLCYECMYPKSGIVKSVNGISVTQSNHLLTTSADWFIIMYCYRPWGEDSITNILNWR
jgi:hypothetical protein